MENLEQPLQNQLDNVRRDINRLNKLFGIDEFNSKELTHGRRLFVGPDTGINRKKAIRHLAKIGEVKILDDDGNKILFKVTEKFGKLPNATIGVPLSDHILRKQYFDENLEMMMGAYAILANFENRLRFLISSVLEENYGDTWWEDCVKKEIKNGVKDKKGGGLRDWHVDEDKQNIQYTELKDLKTIIRKDENWEFFEEIFHKKEIILNYLTFLEIPRNIIAHSNVLSKEMYTDLVENTKRVNNLISKYESEDKES